MISIVSFAIQQACEQKAYISMTNIIAAKICFLKIAVTNSGAKMLTLQLMKVNHFLINSRALIRLMPILFINAPAQFSISPFSYLIIFVCRVDKTPYVMSLNQCESNCVTCPLTSTLISLLRACLSKEKIKFVNICNA